MDLSETLAAIGQQAGQAKDPELVTIKHEESEREITILVTRDGKGGMITEDMTDQLAKYDQHPLRRTGTATLQTLDSLIDHVNRFKNAESALFAHRQANHLTIQAVLNYHDARHSENPDSVAASHKDIPFFDPKPQHGDHRAMHAFPLSDEIKAWNHIDGKDLSMSEFALFLEDNILDVLALPDFLTENGSDPETEADIKLKDLISKLNGQPCGPKRLMELSKGLQINEDSKVRAFINPNTGEQSIAFENEHQDEEGNKLSVPNMFLIAIPIFEGGQPYRIPVRLRYRKRNGVIWLIEPYQIERYIKHAFAEACENAAEATGLPLFFGEPETAS